LNRYWTFQRPGRPGAREGARFLLITLAAMGRNDLILWFMGTILHPAHLDVTLWANISKVVAIGGTIFISYLGMRLWVLGSVYHRNRKVV
jgi:putative flippase GtrA